MVLAATTVIATLLLFAVKLWHRLVLAGREARTASYTAAVGDMISRGYIPPQIPRRWRTDPLFHSVLIDYRKLLTGVEVAYIDTLVERFGIVDALMPRIRRLFPPTSRLQAVATFVELADRKAAPLLISLLDDHQGFVRTYAAHGLARMDQVSSVPVILDLSNNVRPWEAGRLTDALVAFGPPAVAPIVSWIEAEVADNFSVDVVAQAARVLGLIGDPAAEPVLLDLLTRSSPKLRLAAASALARVGTDAATLPLLRAFTDESWEVRARAVRALATLADASVGADVARLLSDPEWWVRQNAAESLAEIPGGKDHLLAAIDSTDRFAADAALNQLAELRMLPEGRTPTLSQPPGLQAAGRT
jgi:hypothetical protein